MEDLAPIRYDLNGRVFVRCVDNHSYRYDFGDQEMIVMEGWELVELGAYPTIELTSHEGRKSSLMRP